MAERRIETELTLQDHMSEALHHIGEATEALDEKVKEAGHEIVDVFKNAAAVALGFQLEGAIEGMKELGHEAVEAAEGMEHEEKAIRGVLAMIDEEGASLEDLGKEAHELNEQFAEMSETTGAAKTDVVAAFDEMAERTGLATKDVRTLTEEMANAGKAVPGGIGAISEGFSNLSSGIIRARNPIVQMISATGMLQGNAKQVADQLKKMSPQQAMQLGIDAVEKMGAKMKGLPLTFSELVTSLKTIREEIFESLGAPILKTLGGTLERLKGYFESHKETIQHWAEVVGEKVGEWVEAAADKVAEGFEYLEDHAEQIKAAFEEGAAAVKAVVDFILAHKEGIAEAFGAKMLLGKAGGIGGLGEAGGLFAKSLKANEEVRSTAGAAKKAGMFAGVVVDEEARAAAIEKSTEAAAEGMAAEAELGAVLASTAIAAAALAAAAAAVYGAWDILGDETSSLHDEALAAWADIRGNLSEIWTELTEGSDSLGSELKDLSHVMGIVLLEAVRALVADVRIMAGAWKYLGDAMLMALGPVGMMLSLLRHVSAAGPAAPAAMVEKGPSTLSARGSDVEGHIKAPPIYNFTGDIHVTQDFKDTDPDRIVTMMKDGFGRAARSKVAASTHVPQSSF